MPCTISRDSTGVLCARISGTMSVADLRRLQDAGLDVIKQGVKLRLLVLLEDFRGWERSGDWATAGLLPEQDRDIQKIAIVGDEQWRDQACAFVARGLRSFEIEYFASSARAEAGRWLQI